MSQCFILLCFDFVVNNSCDRLSVAQPLFCDVTWKVGGDNAADKPNSSVTLASTIVNYCGLDAMLHVTCVGQTKADILKTLNKAKERGIKNILALRGGMILCS